MSNCSFPKQAGIRVLIVDSSRIGSQLLAAALKRDHFDVTYAGASRQEALKAIACKEADVALISASLEAQPGGGYELASQIVNSNSKIRIILLLETSDPDSVVKAFRAGARGVFGRDNALDLLSKCVTRIHEGQVWATTDELRHLVQALVAPPRLRLVNANGAEILAPREQEVVHWVSEGLTNREIADHLGLSENTIKNYIFRIFDKLGISKRVELMLYAASQFAQLSTTQLDPAAAFDDDATLFRWSREAVKRFSLNQYLLAELYRDGRGVEPDNETALMWFFIAEELSGQLVSQSRDAIQQLRSKMSPREVANAKNRAADRLVRQQHSTSSENLKLKQAV